MIEIYFKTIKDKKYKRIKEMRAGAWISVENATSEDLEQIAEITGLSSHDLQDTIDNFEVSRIERQEEGILLYVRTPDNVSGLHTQILTIITTDKYLITISPYKNKIIDYMLEQKTKISTTQKSKLLLRILNRIAQEYTLQVKNLRSQVASSTKENYDADTKDFIFLAKSEEVLNQYLSALIPMNNVFEAIRSGKYVSLYAEDEDLVQDIVIGIKQSADICAVNLRNITSIRDSYQVIFTNNLNKVIKLLTALTVIVTIPTMIASLYGMNVSLPFSHSPWAFIGVVLTALLFSLMSLFIFYRKKWL